MKPKIVILPGWGGTKETWKEFVAILEQDFDVECFNLPCFGDEPCPKEVWGVEEYANFVRHKIERLNTKVILVGHSFGGQVAAFVAAKYPQHITKLILVAPAIFRPKNSIRRVAFGFIAKTGKYLFRLPFLEKFSVLAKKILYRAAQSPDYGKTAGIKRDIFRKIIRQDLKKILPEIKIPTYIIWGTKDAYTPVEGAKRAVKLIPQSRAMIVKGGRHGLHIQQPHELSKMVANIISQN